jgi:hypothetical protein
VVAFPMDGGMVPEKLFDCKYITSIAGSFDKSSKPTQAEKTLNEEMAVVDYIVTALILKCIWIFESYNTSA